MWRIPKGKKTDYNFEVLYQHLIGEHKAWHSAIDFVLVVI